ncbi:MGMT family protein [Segetibacter koreensis]|uniref:MGMT family protein n=1 Tax=Segetibacter koreensis TaxID=398037 RepID=UPI00036C0122|nr:MGMT family protein [Segetibacter koreensis]
MKKNKSSLELPIDSNSKNYTFFQNVWDVVRQIPEGRVTSYGAIASYLGAKSSSRMVGWAMHGSFIITPPVPAQRVVNRNGMLTGKVHFATPTLMEELLHKEGIRVEKGKIVDFEKVFWDPAIELG